MSRPYSASDRFTPVEDSRPDDVPWPRMSWPPPAMLRLSGRVVDVAPVSAQRDAAALFAALDHDEVWEHVPGRPPDPGHYAEALGRRISSGCLPWVVRLRTSYAGLDAGAVVGTSAYLDVSTHDARLEIGSTAYTPQVWGTAVNPDTKLVLLTHAFESIGVGRVQLKTDVRNAHSQAAIASAGARYEGTLRRYQRRADGTVRDTVLFSILAEEWPSVREHLQARLTARG
jgi:N-acetyltransferase